MAAATSSSRWQVLVGFLRYHDDPPKLPQEGVDVQCPPVSCSAINLDRDSLPTSFATSSVEDYVNISVTGETLLQRLVHQGNTPRNDKECSLVHIPISTLKRTQITASGCGWTASDRIPPPHDTPPTHAALFAKASRDDSMVSETRLSEHRISRAPHLGAPLPARSPQVRCPARPRTAKREGDRPVRARAARLPRSGCLPGLRVGVRHRHWKSRRIYSERFLGLHCASTRIFSTVTETHCI